VGPFPQYGRRYRDGGDTVVPPVPAFYAKPASIGELDAHTTGCVLDLFGIEHTKLVRRWVGLT